MKYDVITIGSGLGGLVSSVLLAKRGKKVLLLEQHWLPGGYCTSYTRKGFTFNVPSILGPLGSEEATTVLAELGFYDEIRWTTVDRFARYVYPDLEVAMPANDLSGCEAILRQAFPEEARAIGCFFSEAALAERCMALLQNRSRSLRQSFALLYKIPRLLHLARTSFYQFMRRLTDNERLITILSSMWGYLGLPPKRVPALLILGLSAACYGKPISFPEDGFQAIADFFARKLEQFGGEIRYRTRVDKILLDNKRAAGVETAAGERLSAKAVISNADTKRTFLQMVGRSNLSRSLARSIDAHEPSMSGVSLHIGTDLDLSRLDLRYGSIFCQESWEDSDSLYDRAMANEIRFEKDKIGFGLQAPSLLSPRLAPAGKHILHVLVAPVARQVLNGLDTVVAKRGKAYRMAKKRLSEILIRKVERLVPGLSRSIVVTEMATPLTFERYTGATGGAWYDGVHAAGRPQRGLKATTPIRGLYLTGTKAFAGGGMPPALVGGIQAAQTVLADR
jgi:phytoene dehydrogenase-like protein